jgi:hypothetical protein
MQSRIVYFPSSSQHYYRCGKAVQIKFSLSILSTLSSLALHTTSELTQNYLPNHIHIITFCYNLRLTVLDCPATNYVMESTRSATTIPFEDHNLSCLAANKTIFHHSFDRCQRLYPLESSSHWASRYLYYLRIIPTPHLATLLHLFTSFVILHRKSRDKRMGLPDSQFQP